MDQRLDPGPLRQRAMGQHDLTHEPMETLPGWVVTCVCGWTNTEAPGQNAAHARLQFTTHVLRASGR